MFSPGGVNFPSIPVGANAPYNRLTELFRADAPLRGLIVETAQGLALQVSGARIPLPPGVHVQAGQYFEVVFDRSARQLRLRILDAPDEPLPTSRPPVSSAAAIIERVLAEIDQAHARGAANAARVLPPSLPLNEQIVRTVLTLLLNREQITPHVAVLASTLRAALRAGVLAPDQVSTLIRQLQAYTSKSEADLAQLLRAAHESARQPAEARIAAALNGKTLEHAEWGLREQITFVRGHAQFSAWLRETGSSERFDTASRAVNQRLDAAQLQNLWSTERQYHFFDLPWTGGGFFHSAQFHIFGDGRSVAAPDHDGFDHVVLDLDTTRLGRLWVSLKLARGACQCEFQCGDASTVQVITDRSDALEHALAAAGYAPVQVRAVEWNGDRLEALARAFARFGALNVEG